VRFHFSDGPTPGLMLAEIVGPEHSGGEDHGGVVFCADLIPGRPWVHVPITMGYDRNAELLIDEKRAVLEDMLARNVHLFFTHDPGCALAQVTRDEKGRFGTTHEHAELERALSVDADNVAFGPIYPTILKKMKWHEQGLERLAEWRRLVGDRPLVAIGGFTVERAAGAFAAGADIVSVVTDITRNPDPENRVREWLEATRAPVDAR